VDDDDDDSDEKTKNAPNLLLFGVNHRKPQGYSIPHLEDSPNRIEEAEEESQDS
jgi:hypothetical protein